MKTLSILIMAIVSVAFFASTLVIAEETSTEVVNTTESSNTNNSSNVETTINESSLDLNESVSNGKIFWKEVGLWFTFNKEKKVQKELELAKLRLIQARVAAKSGNSKALNGAIEAHDKLIEKINQQMKQLSFSDSENLSFPAEKLVGLERAINVHEQRVAFLNQTLNNENLSSDQREIIERRLEHTQNVTNQLLDINKDHEEKLLTKIMAKGNLSEDEARDLMNQTRERKGQIRQDIKEVRQEIRENRQEMRNDLKNNSDRLNNRPSEGKGPRGPRNNSLDSEVIESNITN